jgi:amidase
VTRRLPKEGNLKYALSATDTPVDTIAPGEMVQVECEINCNGGVITSTESKLSEDTMKFPFVNPATGPFAVTGARRGQALAVTIHQMELDDIGFTALLPGVGMFPDWVRHKEFGIHTRAMEVSNGFVHWDEKRKLPIQPMVGVIGVAPVHGGVLTVDNGTHGGNLDVQEIGPGNTIIIPIEHDGAQLYVGDCHALQGDGECVGCGATEIGARVTLSVELRDKPKRMGWPRIETPTHIATIGCAGHLRTRCGLPSSKWSTGSPTTTGLRSRKPICFSAKLPRRAARRWSIRNSPTFARSRGSTCASLPNLGAALHKCLP